MILTVATTVLSKQIPYILQGLTWVPQLLTQPCLTTPACVTASLRLHPGYGLPEINYRFLLHLIYLSITPLVFRLCISSSSVQPGQYPLTTSFQPFLQHARSIRGPTSSILF